MSVSWYQVDSFDRAKIELSGLRWIGPSETFPESQEWVTVARCDSAEDSDGNPVLIEACAMPSRFFRLRILAGNNSCGEPTKGYVLSSGSSDECHVALISLARHIAEGMIGLHEGAVDGEIAQCPKGDL